MTRKKTKKTMTERGRTSEIDGEGGGGKKERKKRGRHFNEHIKTNYQETISPRRRYRYLPSP